MWEKEIQSQILNFALTFDNFKLHESWKPKIWFEIIGINYHTKNFLVIRSYLALTINALKSQN